MFTGIVEGTATVTSRESTAGGLRLHLQLGNLAEGLAHGDSVAVAGTCLTVISQRDTEIGFDLSQETLEKTRFGQIQVGQRLNVERSLQVGARLGGHFVSGHVDGMGKVCAIENQEEFAVHTYQAPPALRPLLVPKGSVTVEGVSLTVADLQQDGCFQVALIPETLERTTLSDLQAGDPIHLEGDLLGKYVLRYLAVAARSPEQLQQLAASLQGGAEDGPWQQAWSPAGGGD
ncbi:MAG: riboflavin synthase [Planctomycetota bacterium]|nr:MAG: riboflavin synthase [Planctomycetota bacterium]